MQINDCQVATLGSKSTWLKACPWEARRNGSMPDLAAEPPGRVRNRTSGVRHFYYLAAASSYLAEKESCDAIIPLFLDIACRMTFAEASSFLSYNNHRLKFDYFNDQGIDEDTLQLTKCRGALRADQGIAGLAARSRKAIAVQDAQHDAHFYRKIDHLTGRVTRNLLAVPVLYCGHLLGVVEVINKKGGGCFSKFDQKAMQSLADLFAVGIVRSELIDGRRVRYRLEAQMQMAAKIQSLFLPKYTAISRDSHIWGMSLPAEYLGGDLYDWLPMPDGSWTVYVADVSDKGPPAALYMAALWSRIRIEAYLHEHISDVLSGLNKAMYSLMAQEGFFATILLCNYHPGTGKLLMSSGGHLPALKISNGETEEIPGSRGVALGLLKTPIYKEEKFQLSRGQSVLLVSDGVTEALNKVDEFFGIQGIAQHARAGKGPPWGDGLAGTVAKWRAPSGLHDDLTIVEIWRNA